MTAPDVEIQYCVPCGHLPRAMDIQKSILEKFGQRVGSVSLKTGDSGIFRIHLDGNEIYARPAEFDLDAILGLIESRTGPEA